MNFRVEINDIVLFLGEWEGRGRGGEGGGYSV